MLQYIKRQNYKLNIDKTSQSTFHYI